MRKPLGYLSVAAALTALPLAAGAIVASYAGTHRKTSETKSSAATRMPSPESVHAPVVPAILGRTGPLADMKSDAGIANLEGPKLETEPSGVTAHPAAPPVNKSPANPASKRPRTLRKTDNDNAAGI